MNIPPPPAPGIPRAIDQCHPGYSVASSTVNCGVIGLGENAGLAPGFGIDNDGRSNSRARALNQVWSQQRRSTRYRNSGSQPLTKLSSLMFGIFAALVIGFIVLSPLFHILIGDSARSAKQN